MTARALRPFDLATLLGWAREGLARDRSVFGLPSRSFWSAPAGLDLAIDVPGGHVETPLGVAAGPHTQLAQNLVVGWLAGARLLELKTVQVRDQIVVPRPCIDAPSEGYNIEWSQELQLEESLQQYVAAWCLVHALAPHAFGAAASRALAGTRFDASVGYDLQGIRSESIARFLDGLTDARESLTRLRDTLPSMLREWWPETIPRRIVDTVTLSSFHGCPPEQIEHIVEHLLARHAVNVVVKLNPTLLGFEETQAVLHGLGWRHLQLDRSAFERDLRWSDAIPLLERLRTAARRHQRTLGVKLTNTLIVRNTMGRLAGDVVYLSGRPLHPLALRLAARLEVATSERIPLALSGGVDADNFADSVAAGFTPVTTCTDLLRPSGYRRLPRYLKALATAMNDCGAGSVSAFIQTRAAEPGEPIATLEAARLANLRAYASRVVDDPHYRADASAGLAAPTASRPALELVDCESCNRCALVCPNGAFFDVASPATISSHDLVVRNGRITAVERLVACTRERQWVLLADFCNRCGNCDTFCPQHGGPDRLKARFHVTRDSWEADLSPHAVLVEKQGGRIVTRLGGRETVLERISGGWRASNGPIVATLGENGAPTAVRIGDDHDADLPLATLRWIGLLVDRALLEVNPLSARVGFPGAHRAAAGAHRGH